MLRKQQLEMGPSRVLRSLHSRLWSSRTQPFCLDSRIYILLMEDVYFSGLQLILPPC